MVGALAALAAVRLAGQTSAAQKSPKAVFVEAEHDVGEVEAGTDISYGFKVKNAGQAPLEIKSVNPG